MNTRFLFLMPLAATLGCAPALQAEIEVWLSVKFILNSGGSRPANSAGGISVSNVTDFNAEVRHGNAALSDAARGFKLRVVEYLDIQPPAPSGEASDYWFNLDARNNRSVFEAAALADQAAWRWHSGAINIFVNNSSSGSCAFVGSGGAITLGASVFTRGTVVHEIGHFFNLSHPHANDPPCPGTPPYFVADGDSLAETLPDHPCLSTRDQLSQSNFSGQVYASLTPAQQAQVDGTWFNVMSYHVEERFLPDQMDRWTTNANFARLFACLGQTWFVAPAGSDANAGTLPSTAFATIARAQLSLDGPNDVILLRNGSFAVPAGGVLNNPVTFCATRGPAIIYKP